MPIFGQLADWQVAFIVTGAPGLLLAPIALLASDARRDASGKHSTAVSVMLNAVCICSP